MIIILISALYVLTTILAYYLGLLRGWMDTRKAVRDINELINGKENSCEP